MNREQSERERLSICANGDGFMIVGDKRHIDDLERLCQRFDPRRAEETLQFDAQHYGNVEAMLDRYQRCQLIEIYRSGPTPVFVVPASKAERARDAIISVGGTPRNEAVIGDDPEEQYVFALPGASDDQLSRLQVELDKLND